MRKRGALPLFLFLFFLFSCSCPCHQWELITIKADCPPITYSKAYLCASNSFNGLEAELICTGPIMELYLNALTLQLPFCPEDVDTTSVTICIEGIIYNFIAQRFQGGQRLLLPEDAQQLIICALLEDRTVEVSAGRYNTILIPDNFKEVFSELG